MYRALEIEMVGVAPLILHNGQMADPLNRFAKAMREVSGKRKKVESDYQELARIEYHAALYMGEDGPVLPARLLEAVVTEGAKRSRHGKAAQAGIIVERHASLEYDGPRGAQELFEDDRFRLVVPVRIGQIKVMRTRPIFEQWSAKVTISYLPDVMNERDLVTAIRHGGALCGVGDWRPRFGRFALRQDLC